MSSVFLQQGKCYAMDNNVCSELGIYGVILSNGDRENVSERSTNCKDDTHYKYNCAIHKTLNANDHKRECSSNTFTCNKAAGYLVRSKTSNMEDGGVMAGVACLDSM